MMKLSGLSNTTALALLLTAGCTAAPVEEDGRDDSFGDGKADTAGVEEGSPAALGVLDVANTASIEQLEDRAPDGVGLSSRVVDNLMYFRLGDDGRPGTEDDGVFTTLKELDAIPFVGPVALRNFLAYAEANGFVDAHRTAIKISFDGPTAPALVAVRDGLTGAWRPAEMTSPLAFQAKVGGRYTVAVVCEDPVNRMVDLFQEARTLDDGDEVLQTCELLGPRVAGRVTGSMVEAGTVSIATTNARSTSGGWSFDLGARAGTFNLVANSADRIAIRRGIAVAGDVAISPQINLSQEGTLLAPAAFTVTNPLATEAVSVNIGLSTSSTSATIFRGPIDAARIAPGSILAANDRQTASVRAVEGGKFRSLRRPVQLGTNAPFTFPEPIGERFAIENGRIAASWGRLLPSLSFFSIGAQSFAGGEAPQISHLLSFTPSFLAATGITRGAIDTNIPGFKPEWKIDVAREFSRDVFAQSFVNNELASVSNFELVNSPAVRVMPREPRASLRHGAEQP